MIRMPNSTFSGSPPPLTDEELRIRDTIRQDLELLAGEIGERNLQRYASLCAAADFIHLSFEQAGYEVKRQSYDYCLIVDIFDSSRKILEESTEVRDHFNLALSRLLNPFLTDLELLNSGIKFTGDGWAISGFSRALRPTVHCFQKTLKRNIFPRYYLGILSRNITPLLH